MKREKKVGTNKQTHDNNNDTHPGKNFSRRRNLFRRRQKYAASIVDRQSWISSSKNPTQKSKSLPSSKLLFRLEAAFFTRRVTSCRASNILSDDVDDNDDDVGDEEDSTSAGKSEDEDRKRQWLTAWHGISVLFFNAIA